MFFKYCDMADVSRAFLNWQIKHQDELKLSENT